jgi:hypothetical protein
MLRKKKIPYYQGIKVKYFSGFHIITVIAQMIMVWVLRAKNLFDISEKSVISSVRVAELISAGGLVNEKKKIFIM